MFTYRIYRAADGLIKYELGFTDDKSDVFVKNRFDLRELIEETVSLIVKHNRIKFKSIELAKIGSTRASITVNGYVTVNIEYNDNSDQFEIESLKGVVVSPIGLCMLLLSQTFVTGKYNKDRE
jgi:hypothetical protein